MSTFESQPLPTIADACQQSATEHHVQSVFESVPSRIFADATYGEGSDSTHTSVALDDVRAKLLGSSPEGWPAGCGGSLAAPYDANLYDSRRASLDEHLELSRIRCEHYSCMDFDGSSAEDFAKANLQSNFCSDKYETRRVPLKRYLLLAAASDDHYRKKELPCAVDRAPAFRQLRYGYDCHRACLQALLEKSARKQKHYDTMELLELTLSNMQRVSSAIRESDAILEAPQMKAIQKVAKELITLGFAEADEVVATSVPNSTETLISQVQRRSKDFARANGATSERLFSDERTTFQRKTFSRLVKRERKYANRKCKRANERRTESRANANSKKGPECFDICDSDCEPEENDPECGEDWITMLCQAEDHADSKRNASAPECHQSSSSSHDCWLLGYSQ